jgi:hypothetical protein
MSHHRIIVDFLRAGALTSKVWFEVAWLSILWVLWLATAAYATWSSDWIGFSRFSCSDLYGMAHSLPSPL